MVIYNIERHTLIIFKEIKYTKKTQYEKHNRNTSINRKYSFDFGYCFSVNTYLILLLANIALIFISWQPCNIVFSIIPYTFMFSMQPCSYTSIFFIFSIEILQQNPIIFTQLTFCTFYHLI